MLGFQSYDSFLFLNGKICLPKTFIIFFFRKVYILNYKLYELFKSYGNGKLGLENMLILLGGGVTRGGVYII